MTSNSNSKIDNKSVYTTYADKIYDKRYNSPNPLRRYVHRAQYSSIINKIKPGDVVLDAGCGEGVLACLIAKQTNAIVTGVDISEPNIVRAKQLALELGVSDKTTFLVGDAEHINLPSANFDTVISCHVLEHLPNFDLGLSEVLRLTRRTAIVALPTILNLLSIVQAGHGNSFEISKRSLLGLPWGFGRAIINIFGEGVDEGYGGNRDLTHIWRWPWIVRSRLKKPGFKITDYEASTIALPYFPALVPVVQALDHLKNKPFFRNFGYGTTVVLQKITPHEN